MKGKTITTTTSLNSLETISVSSMMTRDVKTEKEDQNVLTACRIIYENNIECVIIVSQSDNNNTKPVGIMIIFNDKILLSWRNERPEISRRWLNESESLCIIAKRINRLNNLKEMRSRNENHDY